MNEPMYHEYSPQRTESVRYYVEGIQLYSLESAQRMAEARAEGEGRSILIGKTTTQIIGVMAV